MRKIYGSLALFAASLAALDSMGGCAKAVGAQPIPSTSNGDLQLTVYKDDFALVHDVRKVQVAAGSTLVHLPSVSKLLDADSVMFDWPGSGAHPDVTGNIYNLGVATGEDMLKRMVGQEVQVQWRGQDGRVDDRAEGRLEVANNGTVVHTKEGYLVNPSGEIVAPVQQSMVTTPQLVATVQSDSALNTSLGVSYLTRGLSWTADYVAAVDPDGKSMRLECWGTIVNHTGTDFPAAKLRLVAGSPNRAVEPRGYAGGGFSFQDSAAKGSSTVFDFGSGRTGNFAPVASGDFYAYDIPTRSDIVQEQMNRARMILGEHVPIHTTYSFRFSPYEDEVKRRSAQVSISFTNNVSSGLGMPLPAGAVRAYDASSGTNAYIGAAGLGDTPKQERVALTLSNAFDVYAKSVQLTAKKVGKHLWEASYSTELHNEKKAPAEVRLVRSFYGSVQVLSESEKSRRSDYSSLEWTTAVAPGSTKTVRYTVRVKR